MSKYSLQLTLENGKVIDAGEIEVRDGVDGKDGKDGLTTSVNGVEQENGNVQLEPHHIGAAATMTYYATVSATWTADGDYFYQDIAVEGVLETDNPIVDISPGDDNALNTTYSDCMCKVFRITTGANSIRVWATKAVATAFPIQLKVVR